MKRYAYKTIEVLECTLDLLYEQGALSWEYVKDTQYYTNDVGSTITKKSHISVLFKLEIPEQTKGKKLRKLFDILAEKVKSGVDVRIITNKEEKRGYIPASNSCAICFLVKNNIETRLLRNFRICHAKILIIDEKMAIIGSHNLSYKSCHANFETSYLFDEPATVGRLVNTFLHLWEDSKRK